MKKTALLDAINKIDTPNRLNLLIDSLEVESIKALLRGLTITVFRRWQVEKVTQFCEANNILYDITLCKNEFGETWCYNIIGTPSGSRYTY